MTGPIVRVGGLDGCRAGWVLVTGAVSGVRGSTGLAAIDIRVVPTFADALAGVLDGTISALGVDMPIGLPETGPRAADQAARRRLGPRRTSVFPTPARATLAAIDYPDALSRSRASCGKGLSKQAFHLLPRIVEVDEAITPELQSRVFECHPETVFARLNGAPVPSRKHDANGLAERRGLLDPWLAEGIAPIGPPPGGAKADDVLDALAVALTAARFTAGDVEHLGDGACDAHGLRMEIVV